MPLPLAGAALGALRPLLTKAAPVLKEIATDMAVDVASTQVSNIVNSKPIAIREAAKEAAGRAMEHKLREMLTSGGRKSGA